MNKTFLVPNAVIYTVATRDLAKLESLVVQFYEEVSVPETAISGCVLTPDNGYGKSWLKEITLDHMYLAFKFFEEGIQLAVIVLGDRRLEISRPFGSTDAKMSLIVYKGTQEGEEPCELLRAPTFNMVEASDEHGNFFEMWIQNETDSPFIRDGARAEVSSELRVYIKHLSKILGIR